MACHLFCAKPLSEVILTYLPGANKLIGWANILQRSALFDIVYPHLHTSGHRCPVGLLAWCLLQKWHGMGSCFWPQKGRKLFLSKKTADILSVHEHSKLYCKLASFDDCHLDLDQKEVLNAFIQSNFERFREFISQVNSSSVRQNGRHFMDNILRCIFMNEKLCIFIKISLKFVPKDPTDNNPVLVQIMAWHRIDKPLPEQMLTWFTDAYMWR